MCRQVLISCPIVHSACSILGQWLFKAIKGEEDIHPKSLKSLLPALDINYNPSSLHNIAKFLALELNGC